MPLNPLDDTIEQLPPPIAVPPTAPRPLGAPAAPEPAGPAGGSLYDQALEVLRQREAGADLEVRRAAIRNKQNADQAVEASRLGRRYHVPTPVVAAQLESYRQRAAADDLVAAGTTNPRLGAWIAADPAHAAIAQRDTAPLSAIDRALGIARNLAGAGAAGLMDFAQGLVGTLEATANAVPAGGSLLTRAVDVAVPERTRLTPDEEQAFQTWARAQHLHDVDHPDSHYDYRGYWKAIAATGGDARERNADGVLHFPDTFKQHGHPTFSVESQFSTGATDGGRWDGETFVPPPPGATGDPASDYLHAAAGRAKALAERLRGDQPGAGFLEKAAYSGIESVGMMLPGLVASVLTGGSGAMLTLAGITAGGQSYNDARDQGLTPGRAATMATIQGLVEVGTEFIPAHRLLKDLTAHAGFVQTAAHQLVPELVGEEVATALQDLNEWAFLPANKDRTFKDYLAERPSAAVATAISVLVSIGATDILTHGTQRLIEQLGTAAEASETRKADPATVQAFVEHTDADAGEAVFYVPTDTFTRYWQDAGVNPAQMAATLTGNPDALAQAATAGVLEIPAARYTATIAADPKANAFFAKEISLDPAIPNAREADAAAAAAEATAVAAPTDREQLRAQLTQQLVEGGRFRPQDADTNARLVEAALGTMAAAADLEPLASLYRSYGVEVHRPDLDAVEPPRKPGDTPVSPLREPGVDAVSPPVEAPAPLDHTPAETARNIPELPEIPAAPALAVAETHAGPEPPPAQKPAPEPPAKKLSLEEQALERLHQPNGIAYGPGGLKMRLLPKRNGNYEMEITEKGRRRFEGEFPREQAVTIGAARFAELARTPTKPIRTPQLSPPAAMSPKSADLSPVPAEKPDAPAPEAVQTTPDAQGAAQAPGDLERGPTADAGEPGGPTGRPGDARAARVAAGEPDAGAGVSGEPGARAGSRKRRAPAGRPDVQPGTETARGRPDDRPSDGADAPSHVDTADLAVDADVATAHARGEQPRHFVIDGTAQLTGGGWTARLDDNLAALRLLKALQADGRFATDAEQQILARYIGWGMTELSHIVDLRSEHERRSDPRKLKARQELEHLLTAAELKELGESSPNAHYSFADLPRAMWAAIARLGFQHGTVLEPAVGTGHFYGTMPGPLRGPKTRLWAVEKEPIAAGIARQLYQDVHVQHSPLQDANLPEGYFDLVISNVPFGPIPIFDPAFMSAARRPIAASVHNYYFGKALDVVRPGGVIAFVTSRYTMDSRSDTVRAYLASQADLLGAVRLPDQAFKQTAGTEVVTDILFLRKRAPGQAPAPGQAWVQANAHPTLSDSAAHGTPGRTVRTNAYFQTHPDHVLGTETMTGKMARTYQPQYNVEGPLTPEQLAAGLARALPAGIYQPSTAPPRRLATTISKDIKQGTFQLQKGALFTYDKGTLEPSPLTGKDRDRAVAFVPLRDAYQAVLDTMVTSGPDATLTAAQRTLQQTYDRFVAAHGLVNLPANRRVLELDPNASRILALEDVAHVKEKKGRAAAVVLKRLADIFTRRTYTPRVEATSASSPAAALTQSLAWKGGVDVAYMQALTGQSEATLTAALGEAIYRDPVTHQFAARDEYLSGDVTTKLAQAQAAAAADATYAPNVAALAAVQPRPLTPEDFPAPFGATWVPVQTYAQFLQEETRGQDITITLTNTENRVQFYVEGQGAHEFLPAGEPLDRWVAAALNGELPRKSEGTGDDRVFSQEATDIYRQSLDQLRERWAEWWPANADAAEQITRIYNGLFNRDTPYVADGRHLVLPNASPEVTLRPWQKNVIWRALQTGNTLIAHAVGAGKTYAMVGIAGEWKRLGLAHKPLVVVPNHLTQQWLQAFRAMYPTARVLLPTDKDFTPSARKRLIARIANNDWDAVVMAQSHFLRVSVKIETLRAFVQEQEDQLLADGAAQMHMGTEDFATLVTNYGAKDKEATAMLSARAGTPRSAKDIAIGILRLRARLQKRLDQAAKDAPVTFEELGVDGLLVDEAHLYKNLYFSTAKNNIAGLKGSDADRAMDMFLKVRQINQRSHGRNVIFATGTPVSNAISELYTMFRYIAQPALDRMGMAGFDSWANANAVASAEMEKAAEGGYKERIRLRKWSNLRELSAQFRTFTDVFTTQDLIASGAVTIPKVSGGRPTVVALAATPEMPAFMQEISDRIEALKTGKVDPKDDNHLLITTHAALAAIDLRLVKPGTPVDEQGRIATAAREVATRYHATTATQGTQIVFLDVGIPDATRLPPLPASLLGTAAAAAEDAAAPVDVIAPDEDIVDPDAEGEDAMAGIRAASHGLDLYGEIRARLRAQGIPDDQIAYVHQARTPYELEALFAAVNDGRIRVLLASTSKGATGMNVQTRLVALHHLDVPWRPADMEQREGRILRQGNTNAEVDIVRYVTKESFDEYRWGLLATKQASIVALMKGELTSMDDVDPAQLDMQVAQALASGDPRTLQMLNTERELKALQTRYLAYTRRLNAARRNSKAGLDTIDRLTRRQTAYVGAVAAAETWKATPQLRVVDRPSHNRGGGDPFDLKDTESRKALQARLEAMMTAEPYQQSVEIGTGGPFTLALHRTSVDVYTGTGKGTTLVLEQRTGYYVSVAATVGGEAVPLGATPTWQVGSEKFPDFVRSVASYLTPAKLQALEAGTATTIARLQQETAQDTAIAAKPFAQTDELKAKEQELLALRTALGITRGVPKANEEGQSFGQPLPPDDQPPTRRGSIDFGVDPQTGLPRTIINLLARADLSTFLHEAGHFFLEVFGDLADRVRVIEPATRTPGQQRLLADYDQTLEVLGVTSRTEVGEAQHEQWATSFESYLREGHAPSLELLEPFARFRAWLLDIYRSVVGRAPVSDQLKGIFDRMLASEDAITEAEAQVPPLFTTAQQAGYSDREFELYRQRVAQVHRFTRESLDRRIAAEVRRTRTAQWQAQRAAIDADVTADIPARPIYRALTAIREGLPTTDPGEVATPLAIDHATLVDLVGADRVAALPPGLTTTTDGTSPALVAEITGFDSVDALVQALTAAPPIATVIAEETDRRMVAAHGDLLRDGTLHETVRAAHASDDHDTLIRAELKALWGLRQRAAPGVIARATPRAQDLARLARARIAGTPIRRLNPNVYWAEARRASTAAVAAAAKGDTAAAITAKTKELANLAFYREAVRVKELVTESRRWVDEHDTPRARARLGKAGEDYLDQWDGILDRFDMKPAAQAVLDRRENLMKFVADQEAQGLPLTLPAIVLDEARRKPFQLLTVEDFLGVVDGLRAIVHIARLKNRLLRADAAATLEAVTSTIGDSIRAHNTQHPLPLEFTPKEEGRRRVAEWFASHAKLARLARVLDGHVDGGPMWEHLIRPINAAADAQITAKRAAAVAYGAIVQRAFPQRRTLRAMKYIAPIGASLSKEARIAVALNWGNQTSRDRLVSDPQRRWSQDQVEAVLDTLDQRDWGFVQATWDYLNTFWPAIAAKQERVVGIAPEKVEALEVHTRFGTYAGGYYPLTYDGRLNLRAGQHEIGTELKLATLGNYGAATTKRGHLEKRLENVHMSVRLDLGVVYGHLEQIIHDLTHHEMLIDVSRILRDPTVQQAIFDTRGDLVYSQFSRGLIAIAGGDALAGRSILDKAAQWAKTGTQISVLGLNVWTAMQQPLGIFNGMSRVGPVWVARGLKRWLGDAARMQNTLTWIASVSPMMQHRADTATPELHDLHRALRQPGSWFDTLLRRVSADHVTQETITDGFLWHIALAQRVADIPTWLGQYEKSLAAMGAEADEARAIALADQAVLDSQGGGQIKDLAAVQRGGPIAQAFMTFYSYGNTLQNETAARAAATNVKSPASVLTFLGHLSLLYAAPALVTVLLARAFGKSGGDDDDAAQFLVDVGQDMLSNALNGYVFVREFSQLAGDGVRGYAGPAGTRVIQQVYALGRQVQQGELDEALARAAFAAGGVIFRYPATQVQRTIDGWVALEEGTTHNPLVLLTGPSKQKQAR